MDAGDDPTRADYRYDAFINYRHVEPDRAWAKWLHRALEAYRIPRRIAAERGTGRRLRRVFRDEEELPASAELKGAVETALRESRFLIVVCSPRVVGSRWCNREIERFRELGRHDRILALLIEGEPGEAFPPTLREIRRTVTDAAGLTRGAVEQVEPLAADVRPVRSEPQSHLRRMATLRLMACLLGVRFDDLRRRAAERRQRWVRRAYGVACAAGGIAAVVLLGLRYEQFDEARNALAVRSSEDSLR